MASNTVIVRVLGNTKSLSRSLNKAQRELGGLQNINRSLSGGFRAAAIGAAVFGAATVGAGAAGAAALAAVPAAIVGIGVAFAAQNKRVQKAFTGLKDHVVKEMTAMSKPFVPVLTKGAVQIQKAFDTIAPYLNKTFKLAAPLLADAFKGLQPIARQIGPTIFEAFKAGEPVLRAFGQAVLPITKGVRSFFQELGKGSPQFTTFVQTLGSGLQALLPAVGRLITALAPIGTVILSTLVPALVSLLDTISAKVGPAFTALTTTIQKHPTLFKAIGIAVLGFMAAVKIATVALAAFSAISSAVGAAVTAFGIVMKVVKAAVLAFRVVMLALNIVMYANPIGLVIAAIVALVAVFVLAYKKSETFRNIVNAAWNGIKAATVAVWNFLKTITVATWNFLKTIITTYVRIYVTVVKAAWNAIKAATSAVWNGIKAVVSAVAGAIRAVVTGYFNAYKTVILAVWNAAKAATSAAWNAIKSAVSTGVNAVMSFVRGLPGQIQGVFSAAGSWLLSAGRNIIQGLLDGISSMIGSVRGKLSELTNLIPDWKGPRSKDRRLLRPVGRLIMKGLIRGFDDGRAGIKKSLERVTNIIERYFDKKYQSEKKAARATKAAMKSLGNETKRLMSNAKQREKIYKRLEKARDRLADLRKASVDYAKNIAGSAKDFGAVTNLNTAFTADAMLQQMKARIDKVRQYNAILRDLIKKGLNKTMIDQLAQAGVEGGLATALAIQAGGKDAVNEFNGLQKDLNAASNALGKTTADSMYKAGIQAAAGIVRGLQRKKVQLERAARRLGLVMVRAIKKALKINSPSKVFQRLGEQTLQGMQVGLKDLSGVKRATVNIADAMTNSFDRPRLEASAKAGGKGGDTVNITVQVSPTADKAAIGREVAAALDAFYKQGGRRLAT